ncbi:MAG: alkaline phosphatase family protein [Ignavibacteriales bacterium]|nr:alkaline phosphatase family protein [Ignavibacteriales bacterium]
MKNSNSISQIPHRISQIVIFFFLSVSVLFAKVNERPKLVVAITIDQFPYEYLEKFRPYFGKGGFNLLLKNGANFTNATYKHSINETGPGHASIYSGCYGNKNGIVMNDWFDRKLHRRVNCAEDTSIKNFHSSRIGRSPKNNLAYTVGDMLRLSNNFQSKVIGISMKDRGAIFPAGKFANAAYWIEDSMFTSSNYYMQSLPDWVEKFNARKNIDSYFGKNWNKLLVEKEYKTLCDIDDAKYESDEDGLGLSFPHIIHGKEKTPKTKTYYEAFFTSPFCNDVLLQFAKEAIEQEQLGKRNVTDMLCVSFSANDYVGHNYGPNSQEVMDITVRTDRLLEEFFKYLDKIIGLKNCVITLTADHGVAPIPDYLKSRFTNIEAGKITPKEIRQLSERFLNNTFGTFSDTTHWIDFVVHHNIYISEKACKSKSISVEQAAKVIQDSLLQMKEIVDVFRADELKSGSRQTPFTSKLKNSFFEKRSGDVFFVMKPYYLEDRGSNTTHGAPYNYDAHVPVLFYGKGVMKMESNEDCAPIDIAATLSSLLGIEFPPMSEGRVLEVRSKK